MLRATKGCVRLRVKGRKNKRGLRDVTREGYTLARFGFLDFPFYRFCHRSGSRATLYARMLVVHLVVELFRVYRVYVAY